MSRHRRARTTPRRVRAASMSAGPRWRGVPSGRASRRRRRGDCAQGALGGGGRGERLGLGRRARAQAQRVWPRASVSAGVCAPRGAPAAHHPEGGAPSVHPAPTPLCAPSPGPSETRERRPSPSPNRATELAPAAAGPATSCTSEHKEENDDLVFWAPAGCHNGSGDSWEEAPLANA